MTDWLQRLTRDWPDRHQPARGDLAFDAKTVRDWIAHLPLANPAATSRQLFDAVTVMNYSLLDPQQRLDCLEALREPIAQIVATLDRQVQVESFPLPPAKLQVGRQSQEFEAALALGYTQSLYDLVAPSGKVPFLRGKAVALAATRALQHGGSVLAKAYLVYYAPVPGAWLRLHELYVAALHLRVDDKAVADPLLRGAEVSARAAYCHALLLALSNPYRFNQRDLDEVVALTRAWAPYCRIEEGKAPDGAFAIETDQDRSLGYVPAERRAAVAGLLSFDPTPAAQMIQDQLDLLPPGVELVTFRLKGGAGIGAQRSFVERLVRAWAGGAERGHTRLAAGHSLDCVLGLHALHTTLADGEDFEAFMRRVRGEAVTLSGSGNGAAAWTTHYADRVRPAPQRAKVLDQSLGGYHLAWDQGEALRAKIGEVIGLAPPAPEDEAQDWMVGVLRWIRTDRAGRVDAGVELLARRVLPVGIATIDAQGLRPALRALQLCDADGEGVNLLAPQNLEIGAIEAELTRPADPADWQSEASVVRLNHIELLDAWGAYRRVRIGAEQAGSGADLEDDDTATQPVARFGAEAVGSVTIAPGIAATGT